MKTERGVSMPYFIEIPDYATYSGHEADFHFTYNANSGGGQAFLGGRFRDASGHLVSPEVLNGKNAILNAVSELIVVLIIQSLSMTRRRNMR